MFAKLQKPASLLVALALAGCAITPQEFAQRRYAMTDLEACKAAGDADKSNNFLFRTETLNELNRRGLTADRCSALIADDGQKKAAVALAIIGVLAIAAASRGGGSGGGAGYAPNATDYRWEWDQFYNEYNQLVWACRGVQSGQFADFYRCNGKIKADLTWPHKRAF